MFVWNILLLQNTIYAYVTLFLLMYYSCVRYIWDSQLNNKSSHMNIPFRQYKNINIFSDIQKCNIDHFSANLTRKLQTIGMYKQRNILYNINKKIRTWSLLSKHLQRKIILPKFRRSSVTQKLKLAFVPIYLPWLVWTHREGTALRRSAYNEIYSGNS